MTDAPYLTYCLNAHPAETLAEVQQAIRQFALPVRRRIHSDGAFPLGLRLSAQAAGDFQNGKSREEFLAFLQQNNLHPPTANAFPIGAFHDTRVKENVYLPDWSDRARMDYTLAVAQALAACESPAEYRSISTCPLFFKPVVASLDEQTYRMECTKNLIIVAVALAKIEEATGQHIVLAIEPEPGCFPETTDEVTRYFDAIRDEKFLAYLAEGLGCDGPKLGWILGRYLGVCFDAAHQAVLGEDLIESFDTLRDNDIPVAKLQLSSAIVCPPSPAARDCLCENFADDVYLHQTMTSSGEFYLDLPEAIKNAPPEETLRVHYHVPIHLDEIGPLQTTNAELCRLLDYLRTTDALPDHLEIETYTWPAIAETQSLDIIDGIAREFEWANQILHP